MLALATNAADAIEGILAVPSVRAEAGLRVVPRSSVSNSDPAARAPRARAFVVLGV
jgi:hypothetical protein